MKNQNSNADSSSVIVGRQAPSPHSQSSTGETMRPHWPDCRERELQEIIEAMESEASGARGLLDVPYKADVDAREISKLRAEALEDYASQLKRLLPESAGGACPANEQGDTQ